MDLFFPYAGVLIVQLERKILDSCHIFIAAKFTRRLLVVPRLALIEWTFQLSRRIVRRLNRLREGRSPDWSVHVPEHGSPSLTHMSQCPGSCSGRARRQECADGSLGSSRSILSAFSPQTVGPKASKRALCPVCSTWRYQHKCAEREYHSFGPTHFAKC